MNNINDGKVVCARDWQKDTCYTMCGNYFGNENEREREKKVKDQDRSMRNSSLQ